MKLKFNKIKQLYLFGRYWFLSNITIGLEKEWFNTYSFSLYFPLIEQGVNSNNIFGDVETFGGRFPTEIIYNKSDGYYGFYIKKQLMIPSCQFLELIIENTDLQYLRLHC